MAGAPDPGGRPDPGDLLAVAVDVAAEAAELALALAPAVLATPSGHQERPPPIW